MNKNFYTVCYIYDSVNDRYSRAIYSWFTRFFMGFRSHVRLKAYIKKISLANALKRKIGTANVNYDQYTETIYYRVSPNKYKIVRSFCDITRIIKYPILSPVVKQKFIDDLGKYFRLGGIVLINNQIITTKAMLKKMIP